MSLRKLVGLSGVAKNENYLAQTWGRRFEFWMILIAIWLPLQWTMEQHHQMSKGAIYIGNWLVWLFFVTETICLLKLANNKKHYILTNWMNPIIIILGFPAIWNHTALVGIIRGLQLLIMMRPITTLVGQLYSSISTQSFGHHISCCNNHHIIVGCINLFY